MKQKLADLKTLITGSKKAKVIVFVALLLALLAFFFLSGPTKTRKVRSSKQDVKLTKLGKTTADEATKDLLERFKVDFDELRKQNDSSKEELDTLRKQQIEYEQRTAEIFKKMLERIQDTGGSTGNLSSSVPAPIELGGDQNLVDQQITNQDSTLESFGPLNEPEVAPPAPPAVKKIAFVGAGDSVRVKLLAGVNAPTDGSPYPVVFKLYGDVNGPDNSILPLGEARLIAAAQGSITDSRALFRLTSLNIRLPSGERKVINVDGWVVGEDGIRGLQGVLIDPIGKAIAGAAVAAGLAGYGAGIQAGTQRNQSNGLSLFGSQQVISDVNEYAAGSALATGAKEWSGIIKDRLNQMVPVIQVLSGREATAIFAKSVEINNLFDQLEEGNAIDTTLD